MDGYWFGNWDVNEYSIPVLIQFKNYNYYDYLSSISDTCSFWNLGERFYFKDKYGNKFKLRIENQDSVLIFRSFKADTFICKLWRAKEKNYFIDRLGTKSISIQPPYGIGEKSVLRTLNLPGFIIYAGYRDSQLVFSIKGHIYSRLDTLYRVLLNEKDRISAIDRSKMIITLFADKNISYYDLLKLKDQFRIAGIHKIRYVLNPDNYADFNIIMQRIPPMTIAKLKKFNIDYSNYPPGISVSYQSLLSKKKSISIQVNSKNIKFNGQIMDSLSLDKHLVDRVKKDKDANFILSIDSSLTYQEYISLIDQIQKVYKGLRDNFLNERYGTSNEEKLDHLQIDSAYSRYPMRVLEKHYIN